MTATRVDIVRVARSYLGTPFQHQAREPGVAIDCIGVLICAARELEIRPADFDIVGYAMHPDGRSLIRMAREHMTPIGREDMQSGDAIVLRWGREPQHFGILGDYPGGGLSIIHAYSHADGKGSVIEHRLDDSMLRYFVAAFAFPGVV